MIENNGQMSSNYYIFCVRGQEGFFLEINY